MRSETFILERLVTKLETSSRRIEESTGWFVILLNQFLAGRTPLCVC